MTPALSVDVLAHGVGGSTDLPVPLSFALIGAAWALTATFAVVALAWKTPRFDPNKPGRDLPTWITRAVDSVVLRWTVSLAALLFAAWVVFAAVFGPDGSENALPGVFYVLLWVGLVAVSVIVGPAWRVISPVRTLYRLLCGRRRESPDRPAPREYPRPWGYWPAAFGLLAFVWLELASPDPGSLTAIRAWLLTYTVLMLLGAWVFGSRWFARADPFEVYSMAVSRLAPFRRSPVTGRITAINPMDHLPTMPIRPGSVAVLAVLLGSTAFDSFSQSPAFRNFIDRLAASLPVLSEAWAASVLRTVGLVVFVSVVGVTFWSAARATGGVDSDRRRQLPGELAHSLIPIVVGYIFAHYISYLVERGQETIVRLADPLGRGWHLLGLDRTDVAYVLSQHPSVLWTIKVSCVVIGHIVAVIAAHDRALRLLPKRNQISGQLAMMLTMVGYTFTGLYLLFGG
ncbi:hypothetical protein [Mycobacterium sp. 29Ha]|uniref:hypothetical protein n=1 Tax=Mycobacterium sp. 29Ha TaxID=2939268 RepID=UPI002938F124|nr:hypothetical protein [Mycobacterium sp. 29Ha]MDV3131360.1 hypothetical protein [Mycobacterium sp. 29Ha]